MAQQFNARIEMLLSGLGKVYAEGEHILEISILPCACGIVLCACGILLCACGIVLGACSILLCACGIVLGACGVAGVELNFKEKAFHQDICILGFIFKAMRPPLVLSPGCRV